MDYVSAFRDMTHLSNFEWDIIARIMSSNTPLLLSTSPLDLAIYVVVIEVTTLVAANFSNHFEFAFFCR